MMIATPSKLLAALVATAALSGCYVVPLTPGPIPAGPTAVVPVGPPQPLSFMARLYPANDLASGYGMVGAVVTNDLNGRGHFSTAIGGESLRARRPAWRARRARAWPTARATAAATSTAATP